jgi:PAS domain S-box-containing protein
MNKLDRARKPRGKTQEPGRDSSATYRRTFRSVLNSSSNIIFVKDAEGRYLYVNPEFQKLCHLTPAEVTGKTDYEIFPQKQAAAFRKNDLAVLRSGKPQMFEETSLQEDGPHTSVVNKFPLRNSQRKIYAICGIVTDITEQKQRETELRQSRARFEQLFEAAPDALLTIDENGHILRVNAQAEAIFGYGRNELTGQPVEVLLPDRMRALHPALRRKFQSAPHRRLLDSGLELYARRKDGSEFPVNVGLSALEGAMGEPILAAVRDITFRKQAEEVLRQSEQRYRLLAASVRDSAIMLLDREGRITAANEGAGQIFGYPREEMVGQHISIFYPSRNREEALRDLAAADSGGNEIESLRVRKSGTPFWASIITASVRDSEGAIVCFSKVVRDITERKTAEEHARELSLRRIQAQDEERSRISRELHDNIGSTMAALLLNLSVMKRLESKYDSATRKSLDESMALAKKCTEDIRTVAYLLHPTMLDELGLLAGLEWYLRKYRQLSGVKVRSSFPARLSGLQKELEISLFNIVQQALLNIYFHSGSREADVSIELTGETLTLKIQDQGKGMPQGARPGLGIGGMQERARSLGGKFDLTSTSAGTTVIVTVPLSKAGRPQTVPVPGNNSLRGRLPIS